MLHLFVAALLTAPHAPAPASQGDPTTLWGKGTRGDATVGGIVTMEDDGSASGEFVLYLTPADDTATACRYASIYALRFIGNTVTFDAVGDCTSVTVGGVITHFTGSNAFTITLGAGGQVDGIDVNMYGPYGITVPGGPLDSGDFSVQ